jgi:hypothetical protein
MGDHISDIEMWCIYVWDTISISNPCYSAQLKVYCAYLIRCIGLEMTWINEMKNWSDCLINKIPWENVYTDVAKCEMMLQKQDITLRYTYISQSHAVRRDILAACCYM